MRKITKIKRSLLLVLSCLLVLCIGICFAGCGDTKDKKYDVTIKVKNNFGQEWIFTPDTKELTYEFEYTGRDMTFYIDSFRLADHPDWGNKWFEPSGEGANVFSKTMVYTDLNGKSVSGVRPVNEKGEYSICFEADSTSDLWNYRYAYLKVFVK